MPDNVLHAGFALATADIEACTRTFQRLTEEKARYTAKLWTSKTAALLKL